MEIFMYILQVINVVLNILKSIFDCVKAQHERKAQDEKKKAPRSKDKPSK